MQYELTLPADYDMGIIRDRVATRGHLLDDADGLGLKAYLMRENGVNQYAPFYLWSDIGAMNRFLWGGGGFAGIVRDFGRPTVRHWTGAAFLPGPARQSSPRVATLSSTTMRAYADPADAVTTFLAEAQERSRADGVHTVALAVDPATWSVVRFTLWETTALQEPSETAYEVLHLSTPRLAALPAGRAW